MSKNIIKIILILGVCLLFCAKFLATKQQTSVITIQFASWGSESEISILKPIIKNFEEQNPQIKIDFMHIPQNYFQKIHLLYASNTAPDIIFLNNHYLPIYANAGLLEDLGKYENFKFSEFYPQSIQSLTWDNKIYAVPRDVSELVFFYNKDLFKKCRIDYPKQDWTFDDFLNKAKKITACGQYFGVSFDEEPLFFLPYLSSNGGWTQQDSRNYFDSDVLNNEANRSGLEFYSNLRKKYHVAPKKEEIGSSTLAQMFLQKKLGMLLSGRWLVPKFRQEADFDWDVINFPNGKNGSVMLIDSSGWAISKSSKHKKQAAKFIQYLSSKPVIDEFTKSGLIVPARIESANSEIFLNAQKPKNSQAFLYTIKTGRPTPVTLDYRKILDDIKTKTEPMFN